MNSYDLSVDQLRALGRDFAAQMQSGRDGRGGSLKMIRTFAAPPSGAETGSVLTVDWGGTNLRVFKVALKGSGVLEQNDALTAELIFSPLPFLAMFYWLQARDAQAVGFLVDLSSHSDVRLVARRKQPQPAAELRLVFEQP